MKQGQRLIQEQRTIVTPEDYEAIKTRVFSARCIEIVAPETAEVRIAGKPDILTANEIRAENTDNPLNLDIKFDAGNGELKSGKDGKLYLGKGTITVTGVKKFSPGEQLKSKKELEVKPLSVQDPDKVTIDGRIYKQTPTLTITVSSGAFIRLL
jgi:predicted chitinase